MSPHRVAILGAGIGAKHLTSFLDLPGAFEVAVVCDLDADRAAEQAARVPGCIVSADVAAVIADPSIDVIDICLPPHLHAPLTIEALRAGKHVICEKPIAGSVLEADAMLAAAKAADRILTPVFQYRYAPGFDQLAALRQAGLTGTPLVATLETHWNRGAAYYAVDWRGTWARERGGAVLSHAIHIHDLVTRFFGPVTDVSAMLDTRVNPIETEDCAAILMRCDSGGLVTSSITLGAATDTSRLRFVFDRLTAESGRNPYAPGEDIWTFTARDPLDQPKIDDILSRTGPVPVGYLGQFSALAEVLQGRPGDLVTAWEGLRSIETVAAIYLSAREGRRVSLPLDRTLPICTDWVPVPT